MAGRDDTGIDGLLREALFEARDTLEEADAWGEELFGDPADPDSRTRLIDVVHTVKEACDQLPLPRLETVAQAATEAADALHEQHAVPTHATMTTILSAIGRMRDILDSVEAEGAEPKGDDAALIGALSAIAGREPPVPAVAAPELADDGSRRYVIFSTASGGPKALDATSVAWMDVIDAVADGPDGGATVRVRDRILPLAALDGDIPAAGRLPVSKPVIVLKWNGRRLALLVEDVLTLSPDPAAAMPAAAEIVAVERLFGG